VKSAILVGAGGLLGCVLATVIQYFGLVPTRPVTLSVESNSKSDESLVFTPDDEMLMRAHFKQVVEPKIILEVIRTMEFISGQLLRALRDKETVPDSEWIQEVVWRDGSVDRDLTYKRGSYAIKLNGPKSGEIEFVADVRTPRFTVKFDFKSDEPLACNRDFYEFTPRQLDRKGFASGPFAPVLTPNK
jgi:hypothetical protein